MPSASDQDAACAHDLGRRIGSHSCAGGEQREGTEAPLAPDAWPASALQAEGLGFN